MKTKQTKQSPNNNRYDLNIERVILAPTAILQRSPTVERIKGKSLLDIYHALVMRKEPKLKKWILENCKFRVKQQKNDYAMHLIHPASLKMLDKHLATDPLGLAVEAIRQEWTDKRTIVVQRGKLVYAWTVRIAKRK